MKLKLKFCFGELQNKTNNNLIIVQKQGFAN